jgi:hypothetical protein
MGIAILSLIGCADPYTLEVRNEQGPAVRVLVNGTDFGVVRCRAGSLVLQAGINAPQRPWHLELLLANGDPFRTIEIDASEVLDQQLVVLEVGVVEIPPAEPAAIAGFSNLPCPNS